jgi:hypothetical protein
MQLLIDEQKQKNISDMIHNKTLELSDIDRSFNENVDIIEDETQPERKRKRAQKKLAELKKEKLFLRKQFVITTQKIHWDTKIIMIMNHLIMNRTT